MTDILDTGEVIDHGATTIDLTAARGAVYPLAGPQTEVLFYQPTEIVVADPDAPYATAPPVLRRSMAWRPASLDELVALQEPPTGNPPPLPPVPPPPPSGFMLDPEPPQPPGPIDPPFPPIPPPGVHQTPALDYGGLEFDYGRAPQHRKPGPQWLKPSTWPTWSRWAIAVGALLLTVSVLSLLGMEWVRGYLGGEDQ